MNPRHGVVAPRAGHRCEYCRAPEVVFNIEFEVEHIIPRSRGGSDESPNWALACRSCNLRKASHQDAIDPMEQSLTRLFHPRYDHWADHFLANPETGEIAGLTSIGRATIARLEMNSVAQITARRAWMRLGLYP